MTSTIKVNNIQNQCGQNIINENSNTITIGASGDTIALASGASQTGFGREGSVDWQTGSIKTSTFTAVSGEGYFVDTSSGAVTANLPAGSAGAIVAFADYTRTFGTNILTIAPNGSEKIGGVTADLKITVNGQALTLVYVDATEGWINVQNAEDTEVGATFITATGGTITNSGDCKIHTFTGPGTFCVSALSTEAANNRVSYLVVAGGGGGGYDVGGGGGAGGFRESQSPTTPYSTSPLVCAGAITVTASGFPITVGGGGAGGATGPGCAGAGSNSVFSTKTSAGGGLGGGYPGKDGGNGGSGGGGSGHNQTTSGGSGNTPSTSPSQGNNGGSAPSASPNQSGGGGGGATAVGANGASPGSPYFTPRASGATTSISASPVTYAEGGRGATDGAPCQQAGGANTGTGGDAAGSKPSISPSNSGAAGGSGIVIIRYKFQ